MLAFGVSVVGFEEIVYAVVSTDGKIEVRDYEAVVVAEVITDGRRRDGENSAFVTLFRYIDGGNEGKEKIAMTTPVGQQSIGDPLGQAAASSATANQQWKFSFFLPRGISLVDAPRPRNDNITLRTVAPRRMISLRFNGRRSERNVATHEQTLRAYLEQNKIVYLEPPLYAFYNGPFTPNFLRRNEVLFELP